MNDDNNEGVENQVHYTRAGLLINSTYTLYVNSCWFCPWILLSVHTANHISKTLTDEFSENLYIMQKYFSKSGIYVFSLPLEFI